MTAADAAPQTPSVERAIQLHALLTQELEHLQTSAPRVADPRRAPARHLAVALTELENVGFRIRHAATVAQVALGDGVSG